MLHNQKNTVYSNLLFCVSLIFNSCAFAQTDYLHEDLRERLHGASSGFVYSFVDLNYDSSLPGTYNKFYGKSDIFAVYESDVKLGDHLTGGLTYFNVDTTINSSLQLIDRPLIRSKQTINNNSIFGHILKSYQDKLFFNLGGSVGLNSINTNAIYEPSNPGYANTKNLNWFTNFIALYNNTWKNISYTFSGSILYSQVNSGSYQFYFNNPSITPVDVSPLTTRTVFTFQSMELGYKTEKSKLTFVPFVGAGLIQIPVYSTSRPTTPIVNGALPQLIINQNGYRAAAGVTLLHNKFMVRLEEVYYNAGNVFTTYQTIAHLKYYMD